MSWDGLFTFVHVVAFAGWALLLFAPRGPKMSAYVLYLCVGLLCLSYAVMFAMLAAGLRPGDFMSIAGIRSLFTNDGGVVLGWTHYLALDLFVGQWIGKDADHKGFSRLAQVPILLLTLMAGPLGLLAWLIVRERRARSAARA